MADVFLSHSSSDRDAAAVLERGLLDAGLSVWWDHNLVSGQRFHEAIIDELNRASAVVVVWSPSSVTSDWVYSEASRGREQGKLVQVRSGGLQADDLPAPFDAFHCPHIRDVGAVVGAVRTLVGSSAAPVQVPAAGLLPRGTITILVAQVEASIELLVSPAEHDVEAIDATRSLLREAWHEHRGLEYDSQGERTYVAFETAADAVAAAGAAQQRLEQADESAVARPRVVMPPVENDPGRASDRHGSVRGEGSGSRPGCS